jgi:hypothetical protein
MRKRLLHSTHLGEKNSNVVVGNSVTENTAFEDMKENLHIGSNIPGEERDGFVIIFK